MRRLDLLQESGVLPIEHLQIPAARDDFFVADEVELTAGEVDGVEPSPQVLEVGLDLLAPIVGRDPGARRQPTETEPAEAGAQLRAKAALAPPGGGGDEVARSPPPHPPPRRDS